MGLYLVLLLPRMFFLQIVVRFTYPFFRYILLIMLLQLPHFFLSLHPAPPIPPSFPHLGSCPWVIHISYLASTFPILFLTSSIYFVPTNYASYYLFPHSPHSSSPLIILHVISISVILFLFWLFA